MALAAHAAPAAVLHPPASAFAELLRRSKFASYDPAIRQSYQAPPANAHRGDWGVKRAIALRRKNAFISLTSFEHHAHFTEWNHAENQVRFVRRVEEMGGKVAVKQGSAWHRSLGSAKNNPPFDSDFCPGEDKEIEWMPIVPRAQVTTQGKEKTVNLDSLGKRGPGAYGTQREEPSGLRFRNEVIVTDNLNAMPKRQFQRYLRTLRNLRPEFQQFVDAEGAIKEKKLYSLASNEDSLHYRKFLQAQLQKAYEDYDGKKIEPQPHPNAALSYRNPTSVESTLWTKPKPGFYLHLDPTASDSTRRIQKPFLASFGGLTVNLGSDAIVGKKSLLDITADEGVKQENIEDSILQLRIHPKDGLIIKAPPVVVGNRPQALKAVRVQPNVISGVVHFGSDNPHPIGSPEYVAVLTASKKKTPPATFIDFSKTVLKPQYKNQIQNSAELLRTLQGIGPKNGNRKSI